MFLSRAYIEINTIAKCTERNVKKLEEKLLKLMEEAKKLIEQCDCSEEIEKLRVHFLGKKGELTSILRSMSSLPEEERPTIGKVANEVRASIENGINEFKEA